MSVSGSPGREACAAARETPKSAWFKAGKVVLPEIKRPQRPFAGPVSLRVCDGFCRLGCTRSTDCEEHGSVTGPR